MSRVNAEHEAMCAMLTCAHYEPTSAGLAAALGDLSEARSLLAQWLADGDTVAVLQSVRGHLDRASHLAVEVRRDERGRIVPVVVSADVPADRDERCAP